MENPNDLLQLYGSVGTDNFLDSGLPTELQIGKFTQAFGKVGSLPRHNYNNVPYSFVGAHWTLGNVQRLAIRAFVMRPIQNHQESPDSFPSHTLFSGMSYLDQRLPWLHTEVYAYYITQNQHAVGRHGTNEEQIYTWRVAEPVLARLPALSAGYERFLRLRNRIRVPIWRSALKPGSPPPPHLHFFSMRRWVHVRAPAGRRTFRFKYDYAGGDSKSRGQ